MRSDIEGLRNVRWIDLNQKFQKRLITFCSNLDEETFPEAVKLAEGKYRTLQAFGKICLKLKRKRSPDAKKQLKEAEKMIMTMGRLKGPERQREKPRKSSPKRRFGRGIRGIRSNIHVEGAVKTGSDFIAKNYNGYQMMWNSNPTSIGNVVDGFSITYDWGLLGTPTPEHIDRFLGDIADAATRDKDVAKFIKKHPSLGL